ncbi:PorT family protein [Sphingobacterium sp. InxBP1]|uniref:porin family protein n=1 Tax=Sphingobacterium sp. InxBP1 TaxID=2870328 RepID=UPI0022443F35|nr:porin family protein [Sphingobacterium sp. InxBP1]MCW8312771.1 PorT family protein [Sphingobacterium sp. InxBP1]
MKRKLLSFAAALCFIAGAKAQTSYGIKAGVNFAKMKISGNQGVSYTSDANLGAYLTGYADIPMSNVFSFQPGISLQNKGGKFPAGVIDQVEVKETLLYIEIPLNFVYNIPTGNTGSVLIGAGPYAGVGINVQDKRGNLSVGGSFSDAKYKAFDAGINLLAGYKLINGILINGGYSLGLSDYSKYPEETGKFKNRLFSLGVGYQF